MVRLIICVFIIIPFTCWFRRNLNTNSNEEMFRRANFCWSRILNNSWRQNSTKQQLYGHLPPITKTIKVERTRHAGHCWKCKDELISEVLLWTPSHGRVRIGRLARTYIQEVCANTGCSPEEAMDDREEWRENIRDISTDGMTWWWWWRMYSKCSYIPFFVSDDSFDFKTWE